ncbi:MAG: cyclomaltodextrinase N-terminal domain-containing protein [Prevotellaceae bacterium]|jgi:glycosidase|nr:cyclomaltodextrinase N-terminal domain-containing protein [Prevotellaceae bacterium]
MHKYFRLLVTLLALCVGVFTVKGEVTKVEPPFWWTEMQNPELQLMVYGSKLSDVRVSISYPGVKISRVELPENSNYLFVYLNVDKSARPGVFNISFITSTGTQVVPYELRMREAGSAKRSGFSSDDVLYLIMPDRFVNGFYQNDYIRDMGDRLERHNQYARHGGDLAGIATRLGYLSTLGVTGIALTPITENKVAIGSYHGFSPTDFYKVDARLGTNEELPALVTTAHSRGLKVAMEITVNHCSSRHPWLGSLPMPDWINRDQNPINAGQQYTYMDIHTTNFDETSAKVGWFARSMPDLNQRNPYLARYLVQNTIWWIEFSGADGIKNSVHTYADFEFLAQWCKEILIEYPNLNIAGETWYTKEASSAWWQRNSKLNPSNTNLKTVMDFPLATAIPAAFTEETFTDVGLNRLHQVIAQDFLYPDPQNILIFADNVDISRFSKKGENRLHRYKQAMAFLLTTRGIPQITYGTEILMYGEKYEGDGMLCPDFPGGWKIDKKNAFMESGRTSREQEAWTYLQKLLQFRKRSEAVRRGRLKQYAIDDGVYAYARYSPRETVIVMINGKSSVANYNSVAFAELPNLRPIMIDVLTGRRIDITQPIRVAPREILILQQPR